MPTATCSSVIATDVVPVIRPAGEADLAAVHAIYAHDVQHGTATYEVAVPDVDEMRRRWRSIVDAGYPFLVASIDEAVVGYAYCTAYRSREGYRWTVEDSVYIGDSHRGQGIGRALLQALIDRCERAGYRQMVAVIGDGANAASIRLHERLGFRVAARFPGMGRKHGRWLENVQMQRALGTGASDAPTFSPLPVVD